MYLSWYCAEDGLDENDLPYKRIIGYSLGKFICHTGEWCPILLNQNHYHWIDYDKEYHQKCINSNKCKFASKNKESKYNFNCSYKLPGRNNENNDSG